MSQIRYKETQSWWWLVLIFAILSIQILLAGIYQWGSKPLPMSVAIVIALIMFLPIILTYNLTITITEEYACAKFGIGLLKRKVLLKDLDIEKAEITHLSLAAGIGYRYGSRGLFLNTKPGPALYIPGKEGKKHFWVGTKNAEEIMKILKDVKAE